MEDEQLGRSLNILTIIPAVSWIFSSRCCYLTFPFALSVSDILFSVARTIFQMLPPPKS